MHIVIAKHKGLRPIPHLFPGEGLFLLRQDNVPDGFRDIRRIIIPRLHHKPHGVVFGEDQLVGEGQGGVQVCQRGAVPALEKLLQVFHCLVSSSGDLDLLKEVLQVFDVPGHHEAAHPVRQVVRAGFQVRGRQLGGDVAVAGLFHPLVSLGDGQVGDHQGGGGDQRQDHEEDRCSAQLDPGVIGEPGLHGGGGGFLLPVQAGKYRLLDQAVPCFLLPVHFRF